MGKGKVGTRRVLLARLWAIKMKKHTGLRSGFLFLVFDGCREVRSKPKASLVGVLISRRLRWSGVLDYMSCFDAEGAIRTLLEYGAIYAQSRIDHLDIVFVWSFNLHVGWNCPKALKSGPSRIFHQPGTCYLNRASVF